jgi:hypothetical protein
VTEATSRCSLCRQGLVNLGKGLACERCDGAAVTIARSRPYAESVGRRVVHEFGRDLDRLTQRPPLSAKEKFGLLLDEAIRRRGVVLRPGTIKDFEVSNSKVLLIVPDPVLAGSLAVEIVAAVLKEAVADVFGPRFEPEIVVMPKQEKEAS